MTMKGEIEGWGEQECPKKKIRMCELILVNLILIR